MPKSSCFHASLLFAGLIGLLPAQQPCGGPLAVDGLQGGSMPAGRSLPLVLQGKDFEQSLQQLDALVSAARKQAGLEEPQLVSDSHFLRRASLDVCGRLPSLEQARQWSGARHASRVELVEQLLCSKDYVIYHSMLWSDLLRIRAEFPANLWPHAAQQYYRSIYAMLERGIGHDDFCRRLLLARGSNFRVGEVNFYRAQGAWRDAQSLATQAALLFMGTRLQAPHYSRQQIEGFSAFFAGVAFKPSGEWKEEIVYFNPFGKYVNKQGKEVKARFLDAASDCEIAAGQDALPLLCEWLCNGKNPWFAASTVNRCVYWLFGQGLVHEPDDLRAGNPPVNKPLHDFLVAYLVKHRFNVRQLQALLLCSRWYQAQPCRQGGTLSPEQWLFGGYQLRRLPAEVIVDNFNNMLGSTDSYISKIPEPFTQLPAGQQARAIQDGSISNSFLDTFARSPRTSSLLCQTRNNRPSAAQLQFLLNSSNVQLKLRRCQWLLRLANSAQQSQKKDIEQLYLAAHARLPGNEERRLVEQWLEQQKSADGSRHESMQDLLWALVNSSEFIINY